VDGVAGELVSGGYFRITMKDADGNEIKQLSPALPVKIGLSGRLAKATRATKIEVNPDEIKVGDMVSLYSVDEGKTFDDRVFVGEYEVMSDAGGKYIVAQVANSWNVKYVIVVGIETGGTGGTGSGGGTPTT